MEEAGQASLLLANFRVGKISPFFFFNLFFLTVLGVHCCTRALSSCGEWGASWRCVGFSLWWLFLLQSMGSRAPGLP